MSCISVLLFVSWTLEITLTYSKEIAVSSGITFTGSAAEKILKLISNNCAEKEHQLWPKQFVVPGCKVSRPSDCSDLNGSECKSGIYMIYPDKTSGFEVYCEMEVNGGGWTVIQRRVDGKTNFFRDWETYKHGFGNLKEEFWLGNEHIHQLLSQRDYILHIDLEDFENTKRYAEYTKFNIGDENSGYKLIISGYHGDAGDGMAYINGQKFSTKDRDNDAWGKNCALNFKGAWWFNACHNSDLNGMYLNGTHKAYAEGVNWERWHGHYYSLKKVSMMVRRA